MPAGQPSWPLALMALVAVQEFFVHIDRKREAQTEQKELELRLSFRERYKDKLTRLAFNFQFSKSKRHYDIMCYCIIINILPTLRPLQLNS